MATAADASQRRPQRDSSPRPRASSRSAPLREESSRRVAGRRCCSSSSGALVNVCFCFEWIQVFGLFVRRPCPARSSDQSRRGDAVVVDSHTQMSPVCRDAVAPPRLVSLAG